MSCWGASWGLSWGDSWSQEESEVITVGGLGSALPPQEHIPPVIGSGIVVLPRLVAHAVGEHGRQGSGLSFIALSGSGNGRSGFEGKIDAAITMLAGADGLLNTLGEVHARITLNANGRGQIFNGGAGSSLLQLSASGSGDHDPDEHELAALLRAA